MKADYDRASAKAKEIASKYGTDPMSILKQLPGVLVVSYAETSRTVGIERSSLLTMFGEHHQAAFTTAHVDNAYLVVYNQQLPEDTIRKALAVELGHIVLGHNGTRPEDVRNAEAECFAINLIEGEAV